jgi:hypothetical protein
MPELGLDFARAWVEFPDPDEPISHAYRIDLTWLTSSWTCIYGQGCQGIFEERPYDGCCSQGAHYTGREDEQNVRKWAARLTPKTWQHYDAARPKRAGGLLQISEVDDDGERKTRVYDDACIFLNRPGFEGGEGCALHNVGDSRGVHFAKIKPDVCWQLPLRRTYEKVERGDGEIITVEVISEFDRRGWGPGGEDLDWYCTSNTEAHVGKEPVYISSKNELIEMVGKKAYAVIAKYCEEHLAMQKAARARHLPLIAVHPATAANMRKR